MRERPHSSRAVEQSSADSEEDSVRRLNERQSLQNPCWEMAMQPMASEAPLRFQHMEAIAVM